MKNLLLFWLCALLSMAPAGAVTVTSDTTVSIPTLPGYSYKFQALGAWGGATITLQAYVDGSWQSLPASSYTANFEAFKVSPSREMRANISGTSGSTNLSVVLSELREGDLFSVPDGSLSIAKTGGLQTALDRQIRIYNVETYGAKGDGRILTDATITSGSATLTSSGGAFSDADVGKWIMVQKAGASSSDLRATVSSVTNATTIILSATASTTVASAGRVFLGTESTAGIQAAITACIAGGGGKVYLPRGIYFVDGAFTAAHTEGATYTAQIVIPSTGQTATATTVEIVGEMTPNLATDAYTATLPVALTGSLIYKTRLSTGYYDCLFSSAVSASAFGNRNYHTIIFEKLSFRNRSQSGSTQVDGWGCMIDGTRMALLSIRDSHFSSEDVPSDIISQSSTAVRLPDQGNYCLSEMLNVTIQGLGTGVQTQEHAYLQNVCIDGCFTGIVSIGGHHGQTWTKVGIWRTARPIYFSNETRVTGTVAFERWTGSGRWYSQVAEDIVGNTVQIRGRLEILTGVAGGSWGVPTIGSNITRTKMQIFDINEGSLVP